jgi:(2Fe-2S) ferredoxin
MAESLNPPAKVPQTSTESNCEASTVTVGHYRHHLFFCTNQRPTEDVRGDCHRLGGKAAAEYTKERAKNLGLLGVGKVRVNQAGCLDRCSEGPVCVVYPDNVWYHYVDNADLDAIVDEHLQQGRIVQRLLVDGQSNE